MVARVFRVAVALVIGLAVTHGQASLRAQDSGKTSDDALDSLLQKLTGPGNGPAAKPGTPTRKAQPTRAKSQTGRSAEGSKNAGGGGASKSKSSSGASGKTGKPSGRKASTIAPKDQAIDDLLEKLGETKDTPSPEERPRTRPVEEPGEPSEAAKPNPAKPSPAKLGGKDKDIDERLEELAGRRKKRRPAGDERSGPIGEIIKEMRDVEKRLGKPDPSEDTQNKQKQIVRHIDTLIEKVRRSESTMGKLMARRMRQQSGQEKGREPGDQTGALARGAPPMKPAKPSAQHSTAGGKDIWGHLPAELRQVMENSFKEEGLSAKAEMISRYFLSIGKGKLVREE
jgi:hypothetical protein